MKRARVVDLIFDGVELVVSVYDFLRNLGKPKPFPLVPKPPLKK